MPLSPSPDKLLPLINQPAELRRLERHQLPQLATELRAFLLDSVARTGGHLSSNLGTVELTLALHYVFNTPEDRLVWDVGHQTYAHKILTGRREQMATLRQHGGLSGFPKRCESPFDTFGVGHSSTSISAALGMAQAFALSPERGQDRRQVVAIIGDGAMSAGQAFEALNNAGVSDANLLVILNDNEMSISPPVGALNKYLTRLMSGGTFNAARKGAEKVLGAAPPLLELAKRAEEHVKGMLAPGTLFEEMGFNYFGPIDGHDLDALIPTLENLRRLKGPRFLHVVTRKGQGYKLAEADPVLYHGVSRFEPENGIISGKGPAKLTYTQVFSDWLCDMANADPRLVGITPAMAEGSGLVKFAAAHPKRYFDVGIAEQHAVTFAAGLACEGLKPVVAIYSTFLQRGYDQLVHDVALQNLDVTFAIDRGGLVGADGPTHHGAFDLSFLTCIPNLIVAAPADEAECRQLLSAAYHHPGPAAVRYPRGGGNGQHPPADLTPLPVGQGVELRRGRRIALLAWGSLVGPAREAGELLDASVYNLRWVKPLDRALILAAARDHDYLVCLEENTVQGGAGAAVLALINGQPRQGGGGTPPVLTLGLPDQFIDHGDQYRLLAELGLNAEGIVAAIREWLGETERAD